MKPRILMVHGAFCAGWAFDSFRQPFEAAGYEVATPPLPGHGEGEPRGAVAGRSMTDYASWLAAAIRAEPTPPIVIGHSMGGLVSMMAATQTQPRALILLASSPPWGISSGTLEEGASSLALMLQGAYFMGSMEPDRFVARLYMLDQLPTDAATAVASRMRPESGRAMAETLNWWADPFATTRILPGRIQAPVLAIAGDRDLIHPPATVRQTATQLGAEFQSFPGMSHWLIGEPGYEAVAEACLTFLRAHGV